MQTIKVTNPYDGSLIQEINLNTTAEVDAALDKGMAEKAREFTEKGTEIYL